MNTVKKSLIKEVCIALADDFDQELEFKLDEIKNLYDDDSAGSKFEEAKARSFHNGAMEALHNVFEDTCGDTDEDHIGCYSYPNCDLSPTGCTKIMGDKVEEFGHKD